MPDTTPPDLNALAFTPNVVNAAAGPQTVTVTAHISDQPAGLNWGELGFRSPSGQSAGTWFDASKRITGD